MEPEGKIAMSTAVNCMCKLYENLPLTLHKTIIILMLEREREVLSGRRDFAVMAGDGMRVAQLEAVIALLTAQAASLQYLLEEIGERISPDGESDINAILQNRLTRATASNRKAEQLTGIPDFI